MYRRCMWQFEVGGCRMCRDISIASISNAY